jgi:tRNA nucleotidyltransferase/poly(A) polymerase
LRNWIYLFASGKWRDIRRALVNSLGLLANLQEDLIYSLSMLGKLAYDSGFELFIVGGVSRNLVYRILHHKDDENAENGGCEEETAAQRAVSRQRRTNDRSVLQVHEDHEDDENAENGVVPRSLEKQMLTEPLGNDIDLLINTAALPWLSSVKERFKLLTKRTLIIIEEFKPFQTVKVKISGLDIYDLEFASARTESYSQPASFPQVTLTSSIKEDISRRDFTINSLLISLGPLNFAELIDYSSALSDMKKGLIRAFHSNSFIDDPTRIYRAFRFALEYGFDIELKTAEWLKAALKDERFSLWFKKRKNRFNIELEKYRSLIPR